MPIYEYQCQQCGQTKEVLQKMDAPAPQCDCEKMGNMIKKVSAAGFKLKGGGWNASDLKGPSGPSPNHTCGSGCKH